MKNNKLTFLKIAIVAVLGAATVLGCEKKEVLQEEQTKNELKSEVSVKVLSEYLAKKINAKLDWISFDQQTEMFKSAIYLQTITFLLKQRTMCLL